VLGHIGCAAERAVAADGDDAINAEALAVGDRLAHARLGLELGAAVGIQDRAAVVDDVGHRAHVERMDVALDQSAVAAVNAHAFHAA